MPERYVARRPLRPSKLCEFHHRMHPATWFDEGQTSCRRALKAEAKRAAALKAWGELTALIAGGNYQVEDPASHVSGDVSGIEPGDIVEVCFYYPSPAKTVQTTMSQRLLVESLSDLSITGRYFDKTSDWQSFGVRQGDSIKIPKTSIRSRWKRSDINWCPSCHQPLGMAWAKCHCGATFGELCGKPAEYTDDWGRGDHWAPCDLRKGHSGTCNTWRG